jgi:hypothetical protein
MNLLPVCDFCGAPIGTQLEGRNTPDFAQAYRMDFNRTSFGYDMADISEDLLDIMGDAKDKITYVSDVTDNLINFYYSIDGNKHPILSINIDNNKVIGSADRVQKVIWDHKLAVSSVCMSKDCKYGYVNESTPIYLERKGGTIFPLDISLEAYTAEINGKNYMLTSSLDYGKTVIYSCENEKFVTQLPFMYLYTIRGKDNIINKIKTYMVFS